ncbi:CAP domain-containing protein [Actinomyces sp. ZJ308]|uniref:CAP domain-containing protein n=1 Tax=Actinomyces sp. ZJ308 TaxID=2708342 RepID=UPI00141EB11A|nr:CAP domain-containing protein [Actinomyces sp. ZJ308]
MNIKRVIAAAALTVVPLTVSSTALAAPAAPQGAPAAAAAVPAQVTAEGAQYADTVLTKVNELRRSLNLQPVTRYQELDSVAQEWSEHQASTDTMEHRPNFTSAYPAGWTTGSENVAWRTAGGDTGALIFDQWLNSPGHYQNMVDPNVNSIGIGFAQTSSGKWYATQNFAAYNPSNTPLTPTTTSNTPPSSNTPPTDTTTVTTPAPTPETTPSAPSPETTPPTTTQTTPPATETTPEATPTPSAPATTATTGTTTTTATGTPAKPSSTPAVAAPGTTPTKPALATTGPSIVIAVLAAGLLGTGAFLVMRRRQAS